MSKKKRNKQPQYTPINHHKKKGTKLKSALSELNMEAIEWGRDLLPEHLWIAALADKFGISYFHKPYNEFLNVIDQYWSQKSVALGLISDFALIPEDARTELCEANQELIHELFHIPLGRILAFYPECPASWLVDQDFLEKEGHLDPEIELGRLRSIVRQLIPGKESFPARVRIVPLNRLLKHERIFFQRGLPSIDLLPKYPVGLNDGEKQQVEAMVRSTMNMTLEQRNDLKQKGWSKYFWRHNYDLVACRPIEREATGTQTIRAKDVETIERKLSENSNTVRNYLAVLQKQICIDLYDPTRDEVLFGLFTRLTRLYALLIDDVHLWARDVGAIMLRCFADTVITFAYLIRKATTEEFKQFVEYGEGQQKLLMLHLQDNYPGVRSLDGLSAEEIGEQLDIFPEMLDIELGHWTKKNTRRLAQDAGLDKLYRLVYSPTSGDLHGSWHSLKRSNFTICSEPLHRYHRLPSFTDPLLFVNIAETARELYDECQRVAIKELNYPKSLKPLHRLSPGSDVN